MEIHCLNLIGDLTGFITTVLEQSETLQETADLLDECDDLTVYTVERIEEFVSNETIETSQKLDLLLELKKILELRFAGKDPIKDTYRNNIKTFSRSPEKYIFFQHIKEIDQLANAVGYFDANARNHQTMLKDLFEESNYKLTKLNLPYTKVRPEEISNMLSSITQRDVIIEIFEYISSGKSVFKAPDWIRGYLEKILEHEKDVRQCSMLWEVLGYVLLKIEEIEEQTLTFADLFRSTGECDKVVKHFIGCGIINSHKPSIGVIVDGAYYKHSFASLIAIAEVLTDYNYIKPEFTITQQVKIMARTFGMTGSKSALSKRSPYHDAMVDKVKKILEAGKNL